MAQARTRAPLQRLADQVAGYFVFVVVAVALLAQIIRGWRGPNSGWRYGGVPAVSALIIASPFALRQATPMSIMAATGRAATQVFLFRDAAAIEFLRKVDTLKTGTLTEGKPAFDRALVAPGQREDEVLRVAAGLGQGSGLPLVRAILTEART